jgi:agmatinase
LRQIKRSHQKVTSFKTAAKENGTVPRIITLGGDHTITLPALRAAHGHFGKVAVLHFDSHLDTWDPDVLSHNQSSYAAINHGTFLHIAHEEGLLVEGKNMHAGIRTQLESMGDIKNDKRCGFGIVYASDIDKIGSSGVIRRIKERIGDERAYISVDIDVLDPAYAPATSTSHGILLISVERPRLVDGRQGN